MVRAGERRGIRSTLSGPRPGNRKARTVQRLSVSCFAAAPPESFPPGRNGGLHRIRLLRASASGVPAAAESGDQIHQPGQGDHAQRQSADIMPGVLVQGQDQRRADSARTGQAKGGGLADIDVKPIEPGGEN